MELHGLRILPISLSLLIVFSAHVQSKPVKAVKAVTAAPVHESEFYRERFIGWLPVGQGAFGTVYRARDTAQNGEFVAIKQLEKHHPWWGDEWSYEKERHILEVIAATNFTRVPHYMGHFEEGDSIYFVMEYCRHGTLEEHVYIRGILKEEVAASMLYQLAMAVRLLHELNYVHNDVYPRNVLIAELDAKSGNMLVKLADFGISETLMRPGELIPVGWSKRRRDMNAMAITLYFALTASWPNFALGYDTNGYPLFQIVSHSGTMVKAGERFHRLSTSVQQLVKKMLRWTLDEADIMSFEELFAHPFVKSGEKLALTWPLYEGDSA